MKSKRPDKAAEAHLAEVSALGVNEYHISPTEA